MESESENNRAFIRNRAFEVQVIEFGPATGGVVQVQPSGGTADTKVSSAGNVSVSVFVGGRHLT